MTRIVHATSLKPDHEYSTEEILKVAQEKWFSQMDPLSARKAEKIFKGANIESRCAVVPLDIVFSDLSFEEKNDLYIEAMISMGERVLRKALEESGTKPGELDFIITTSCTGFMIPSVDAYLVNKLGLRGDITRLPVTEMGCAGGTSGLIYAHRFLQSAGLKRGVVLALEAPSVTFQKGDLSPENLVSTAIFADGASCIILDDQESGGPVIADTDMYHFRDQTHLMGYRLQNSGLKIVLDKDVPDSINSHFPNIFFPFLEKNGLDPADINHYMFHPGGKKIINAVEDFIGRYDKDISDSKNILTERGNMSSATVLHILEKFMKKETVKGDRGYMLAFGPGFMAQSLLLEWK